MARPAPDGVFTDRPPEYNWLVCRDSPDRLKEILHGTPLTVAPGAGEASERLLPR